ncbi:hypothetical protein Hanom_Chr16g01456421 [Helianthus anomalus]
MGDNIRAGETQEHREHIQNLCVVHKAEERDKREKKRKRPKMTASETPVTMTPEQEQMDAFVDELLVDPEKAVQSKTPLQKKKKIGEGSSKVVLTKPTPITQS